MRDSFELSIKSAADSSGGSAVKKRKVTVDGAKSAPRSMIPAPLAYVPFVPPSQSGQQALIDLATAVLDSYGSTGSLRKFVVTDLSARAMEETAGIISSIATMYLSSEI